MIIPYVRLETSAPETPNAASHSLELALHDTPEGKNAPRWPDRVGRMVLGVGTQRFAAGAVDAL